MSFNLVSINIRSVISVIGGGLRAFFGLFTILTVANVLGDHEYGRYVILSSMSAALIYFLDLQVSKIYFVRASVRSDISIHSAVVFWLIIQISVLFVCIVFFPAILEVIYQIEASYLFYVVLTSCFLQHRIFSLLSQLCEVKRRTFLSQTIATSTTLAIFFLVQLLVKFTEFDVTAFFVLLTICWCAASAAIYFALKLSLKNVFKNIFSLKVFDDLGYLLYQGRFLMLIALIGICGEYADRWLLTKFSSWNAVGSYGISKQISGIILIFSAALFPIMIREISESFSKQRLEIVYNIFIKFTDFLLLTCASLISYFLIWRAEIVEMLFSVPFLDIDYLLFFSATAIFHQVLGQSYGTLLVATRREKVELRLTPYFVSLAFISSFIVLSPNLLGLGGVTLVFKQFVLQIVCVTILGWHVKRDLGFSYSLLRQTLVIVPIISFTYVISQLAKVLDVHIFFAMFFALICQCLFLLLMFVFFDRRIWKK